MKRSETSPPEIGEKILQWIYIEPDEQHLPGDFLEMYHNMHAARGRLYANFWYWNQIVLSLIYYFIGNLQGSIIMVRNYIVIAWRNLLKYKSFSLINISGLAVAMACCILIIAFINTELSYDRYHRNADNIYRVISNLTLGEKPTMIASTNNPPAVTMVNDFPEVINAARFRRIGRIPVRYNDKVFYESRMYYADASVFDVFTFPMINGNPASALNAANTVVISETIAAKYFGTEDPVGKTLTLNNRNDFTVTGVIRDIPANSHFIFDMLCSMETLYAQNRDLMEAWAGAFINFSYIQLRDGADHKALEAKMPDFINKYFGESLRQFGADVEYFIQPLTDIHLKSHLRHEIGTNSDIRYVYIFAAIAFFIIVMACINFMNLSTARSIKRAREVGIRKVLGSSRKMLIKQFFSESLMFSFASMLLALLLVKLSLPWFSDISGRVLLINFTWLIPSVLALFILVGLAAGSYPALYLSRFSPAGIFKTGSNSSGAKSLFRTTLVIVQFAISITLIIGTGVIINQLDYMKNKNLGFDRDHVVVVRISGRETIQNINTIKDELRKAGSVIQVSAASHIPGWDSSGGSYQPESYEQGKTVFVNSMTVDEEFAQTLDIRFASGRNFSDEFPTDVEQSVLLNKAAVRQIGWGNPLGERIGFAGDTTMFNVVGVIEDFHYISPHRLIEPLIIFNAIRPPRALLVKINPSHIEDTLNELESIWNTAVPGRPFEFEFLDESFNRQYRAEEKLQQIFSGFTFFAIFIACLGLFGLASFTAEQRTKEFGIRKVLGSSVREIIALLAKDFAKCVLIANVIAWPLAYFGMREWLGDFPYRTEIGIGIFILSALSALLIAMLSVIVQSLKAAYTNPVNSLRYE